jgi:YD repeat-containing protein
VYTRTLRHGIQVVFDGAGRHIRTVARTGQATVFTWGGASGDSLLTVRVPPGGVSGTTYTLAYDGNQKLDRITDPAGRVLDVTVTANRLRSIVDPDTTVATQFAYDSTGPIPTLLKTRRTRRGFTTVFFYQGPLVTQASVPHDTALASYAITGYAPWNTKGWVAHPHTTPQTAVDTSTVFTTLTGPRVGVADDARFWVDKWGAPVKVVGAISDTTFIYRGSTLAPAMVTRLRRPDGVVDSLIWDARGNLLKDSTAWGGGAPPTVSTWTYGSPNAPDSPDRAIGPVADTSLFTYNGWGLTERVRAPNQHVTRFSYRAAGPDSLQGLLERVSDSLVRVYSVGQPSNDSLVQLLSTRFAFNMRGNVVADTSPMGRVRRLVRGSAERVDTVVDPAGHRTSFGYDAANRVRVVRVHPPAGPGGTIDSTRYTWRLGDLTQITDPRGVIRQYRYGPSGRVIGEVDDYGKLEERWFGLSGLLDSLAPRAGVRVRAVYDAAGRRQKLFWDPNGALDSIAYGYDVMGRMLRARQGSDSVLRSYHPSGLVTSEVKWQAGGRISVVSGYDAAGRRIALRVGTPGSTVHSDSATYAYAATGDLAEIRVRWRNSSQRDTVRFRWDPLGRRDSLAYSSGTSVRLVYDGDGALRLVCSRGPTGPDGTAVFDVKSHVSTQDGDGLPTRVNPATAPLSCVQGTPVPYFLDTLAYDHKHQMTYRSRDVVETWQYDASGNRRSYTRTATPDRRDSILPGHNRLLYSGQYTAPVGYRRYTYDDNGARTGEDTCGASCSPLHVWEYDALGRPSGADYLQCPYDPLGRMAFACQTNWLQLQLGYDGANVVRTGHDEFSAGWTFIHGPGVDDPLLAKRGSDNLTHLFVTDGEGRQLAVGKRDGDPAQLNLLGATTSGVTQQSTTFEPLRLASPDLPDISFFRNRWYDHYSGRWTQEDPLGLAGGVNLYQYAGNNPAVWADPFGLAVDTLEAVYGRQFSTEIPSLGVRRLCVDQSVRERVELIVGNARLNGIPFAFNNAYRDRLTAGTGGRPGAGKRSLHLSGFAFDINSRALTPDQNRIFDGIARHFGFVPVVGDPGHYQAREGDIGSYDSHAAAVAEARRSYGANECEDANVEALRQ